MRKVDCDENELVRLYVAEGKKQYEVAEIMGISTSTVNSIPKRRKVAARPRGSYKKSEQHKERNDEIVRLFTEENLIPREISEKLGLAITRVREIIKLSGATKTDQQIAERKEQKTIQSMEKHNAQRIAEMYTVEGMTVKKIAIAQGINEKTVIKMLDHMKVEKRSSKDYEHDKSHLTKDRDDEIVRLYEEEHFSSIQIAEKMDLNKTTILRVLEKRGTERRSKEDYLTDTDENTKKKVIDMFNKGRSESEISEELQIPEYLIINLIASHKRGQTMRVFSDSEEIELLKRYHLGETREELAEEYGISTGLINLIQDRHGYERKIKRIDEEMKNKIIEMYFNEKKSSVVIEKELGIGNSTSLRIINQHQLGARSISEAKGGVGEELEKEICHKYEIDGMPSTDIAKEYEIFSSTVIRILHRRGVELRQPGGSTDTVQLALTNGGRFAERRDAYLYVYTITDFPEYLKVGISFVPDERSSHYEYDEERFIKCFPSRHYAYFLEQAILKETSTYFDCPTHMVENFGGWTEIRLIPENELFEIIDWAIDEIENIGMWEFASRYVPMTDGERQRCLEKAS